MFKKSFALFLVMSILLSLVVPVFAVETGDTQGTYVTILNLKSLEKLAEKCRLDRYSQNLVVSLQTDLDLEGRDFSGIPIFCGRFEGNGHSIRGLNLTMEGSAHGFFRYLTETAVVQNLHLEGTVRMHRLAVLPAGTAEPFATVAFPVRFPVRSLSAVLSVRMRFQALLKTAICSEQFTVIILSAASPEKMRV